MHRSHRLATVGLVTVALLATAGVGFAAFTSYAYIVSAPAGVPPSSGDIQLIVTALSAGAGTPSYVVISNLTGIGTGTVTFDIGPFGPSDTAYLDYTVKNVGTLNIPSPNLRITTSATNACDSLFSGGSTGAPTLLNGGASFSAVMTISEEPNPPAVCAGQNATIELTVTGTT